MADIAAVIGNYRGERLLPDCLASLARQTRPANETIVVDAGSSDRSVDVARALGARTIVTENHGLGHLYNVGARAARAEYVLFANNDVALDDRCLELLAARLDSDPMLFAADPVQRDWEGERLVHGRATLRRGSLLRTLLPGFVLELAVPADGDVPTVSANGAAMLVRRSMHLELGGFDETFFMDYEDLDLCWRAWLRGWGSVHVPEAAVRHRVGAATSSRELGKRLRSSHHNLTRFALKCLPARDAAVVLAGEFVRIARHPTLVVPALVQIAREAPDIARLRRQTRPSAALLAWMVAGQEGAAPTRASPP